MSRSKIHLIPVLTLLILITSTVSAHAWSFITSQFSAPFNQCQTCHMSNSNLAMNPYGDDYLDPSHRSKYASKHPAIAVTGDCNNCHSGKGYPIVRSGLGAMDSDLDLFTNQAEFNAGTFPGDATDFPADTNAPTVTAFSLPATSSTLTVAISQLDGHRRCRRYRLYAERIRCKSVSRRCGLGCRRTGPVYVCCSGHVDPLRLGQGCGR